MLLAEYGAFEILGYQTFTTEIFTEFNVAFNVPTASALSLVLVRAQPARALRRGARARARRVSRSRPARPARSPAATARARARLPVLAGFAAARRRSRSASRSGERSTGSSRRGARYLTGVSLLDAAWHTALYSGIAAALATLMALPVALLAIRHPGGAYQLLERSTYLVLAMPGLVIAFALSYFTERYADGFLYQSAPMLVVAYAILFFPLALVGVRASVTQAPLALEEVARSLGQRGSRCSGASRCR